jgi:hypothetical protein
METMVFNLLLRKQESLRKLCVHIGELEIRQVICTLYFLSFILETMWFWNPS